MERKTSASHPSRNNAPAGDRTPIFPFLLVFAAALLLIPSLLLPPEGDVRSGDAFALLFGWLLIGGGGLVLSAFSPNRKFRLADAAALLLVLCTALSWFRLKTAHAGNLLYAANGFWVFALMPLVCFLFRSVPLRLRRTAEIFLFAVILGAGLFESTVSLCDYFVTAPATRARFREDPESLLRESGMNIEKGSPEYLLFEKRVLDSTEPIGTYGMANTQAGVLAPILVLLAGLLLTGAFRRSQDAPARPALSAAGPILFAAAVFLTGLTLLLTKSRAGYLALLCGALSIPLFLRFARNGDSLPAKRKTLFIFGAAAAGAAVLAFAALKTGAIDKEVFSEAKKSLGYRFDYWTASANMTADSPLLGVGPGNFQNTYPRYILPAAAETIADPHNFAFEYAALFGLPALLCFGIFLVSVFRAALKVPAERDSGNTAGTSLCLQVFLLFLGGYLLYLILNFLTSAPSSLTLLLGLGPVFLAFSFPAALLGAKIARLPSPVLAAALGAGLLNLCAAGGIGYPPTALPLWGTAAVLLNRLDAEPGAARPKAAPRILAGIVYLFLFILFLRTEFYPVLTEKTLLPRLGEIPPAEAAAVLGRAADGPGRHSVPIRWALCTMAMYDEGYLPSPQRRQAWLDAKKALYEESPGSASVRGEMGDEELSLFEATQNRLFLTEACASYAEAAELFPTSALYHAASALALDKAGEREKAVLEKAEALRLDALTPHEDRKIPGELKSLLTPIGENK